MIPKRVHTIAPAALALWLLGATGAVADEGYDDLGGFGDPGEEFEVEIEEPEPAVPDRWWDLDGNLTVSSSINYLSHDSATGDDYTGLSRLRARLNLQLDFELPRDWELRLAPWAFYDFSYLINGFGNFTREVRNEYEWEVDVADTWIQGPLLEDLDLKLGRQVVNWGRSDSLRVIDVLNPLDNREPGRTDIENLRRSVGMAKLDWYLGSRWTLTGIAIPEIRFDQLPAVGNDFNPLTTPFPEIRPDSWENWEGAAAVRGIFEGWDVSLHYAYIFDDLGRFQPGAAPPELPDNPLGLATVHDRIHMAGVGGNYTFGSWLLKAEAAWLQGFQYPFLDEDAMTVAVGDETSRIDTMVGVEYYGFTDTTLAVEIANRHVVDYDRLLLGFPTLLRENSVEYALRVTSEWMNARLTTTLVALVFGWKAQDGAVLRLQGAYDVRDGLELTTGILVYVEGDLPPLDSWGRNDRVFIDLKWSF